MIDVRLTVVQWLHTCPAGRSNASSVLGHARLDKILRQRGRQRRRSTRRHLTQLFVARRSASSDQSDAHTGRLLVSNRTRHVPQCEGTGPLLLCITLNSAVAQDEVSGALDCIDVGLCRLSRMLYIQYFRCKRLLVGCECEPTHLVMHWLSTASRPLIIHSITGNTYTSNDCKDSSSLTLNRPGTRLSLVGRVRQFKRWPAFWHTSRRMLPLPLATIGQGLDQFRLTHRMP